MAIIPNVSSQTTHEDVVAAAGHMPIGSTLVLHDFSWDEYEHLMKAWENRPALRVSYDSGCLEVVSNPGKHENCSRSIDAIVREYCEVHGFGTECYGHLTWQKKTALKGVEPDSCYYVVDVERSIGLDEGNLDKEGVYPPDIAVEIDFSTHSLRKLPIFSALRVPEVWLYQRGSMRFFLLRGDSYVEGSGSVILPGLTQIVVDRALQECRTLGQTKALKAFHQRISRKK